jgi:hypothetical protein
LASAMVDFGDPLIQAKFVFLWRRRTFRAPCYEPLPCLEMAHAAAEAALVEARLRVRLDEG